ncbi:DUF1616 domain-containing protein [Halopiger aswanensis]|uniref:Putative membrane protein n=1 Tax=Halopiger aswanensis TaxID=148449 RepID=A0A3R7E106_9EURY|nr:DUF1616 domain-containing protein [Halopiger aswanensis]RKD97399.1 putative membrane protein [Halopiger aswanensis]
MKDLLIRTVRPVVAIGQGTRRLVTRTPTDLVAVAGFVAVATLLLTVVDVASPVVRAAVGFPLLFLAPGYAIVAALFPRAAPLEASTGFGIGQMRAVTEVERAALAFGLSFASLPLIGLTVAALSLEFTGPVVVGAVSGFVLLTVAVATVRRFRVPAQDRYRLRLLRKLGAARAAIVDRGSIAYTAVNVVLIVSMVIALTSVGYALVSPQQGEQYTSLRILDENDSGELVAGNYTTEIESGESVPLTIAVENQEGTGTEYTAVIQEQWLEDGTVLERTDHQRVEYSVGDGETATAERSVTPSAESGEVRIAVLLYEGDVPDTPTVDNAYRSGYLWVEISDDLESESDE